jgi:putative ABC transport system substrate-binding protein
MENRMNRRTWARLPNSCSDNLKSKTCGESFDAAQDKPRRTIENLKWAAVVSTLLFLVQAGAAGQAQEPAKVWRIGVLVSSSPSLNASRDQALRQGLRQFGYIEGTNLILEYRYAEGKLDRLPDLAGELVRVNPDVIIAGGTRVALAAKQATGTIPIVIAGVGDPLRTGLVRSFKQPGGNVTGVSRISPDFLGKRLGVLKEAFPKTVRVAALFNPDNPGHGPGLKEMELGARTRGMTLHPVAARAAWDFENSFEAAAKARAEALFVMPDALFHSYLTRIVNLAAQNRLPAIYDREDFVEAGGLMSYAVNVTDLSRRAAWYVDQILKGAKPAELPMVEPTTYELVVNLKAATQIGVALPPDLLVRAHRVIK